MLSKIIMKMLGKIEGVCAKCGCTELTFADFDGCSKLVCKNCGSTEIKNVRFSHVNKVFSVGYVKDVVVSKK